MRAFENIAKWRTIFKRYKFEKNEWKVQALHYMDRTFGL
jgi:hypothetical protein